MQAESGRCGTTPRVVYNSLSILMSPMLNIGVRAVRAAGDLIVRYLDKSQNIKATEKSRNDFVTEVDRRAEEVIIGAIRKAYPGHAILAEESGAQGDSECQWIIDPLDGTTNFLHGFPQFAVSVALRRKGELEHAIVYDPLRQELFTASRGGGAQLNNHRIRVAGRNSLKGALIGTGFPFRSFHRIDAYLEELKQLTSLTAGLRRPGSAALDLAYVACGRLDGFWEYGLRVWDIAAGALLIREAGGCVSNLDDGGQSIDSGNIAAGNPSIHDLLLTVVGSENADATDANNT